MSRVDAGQAAATPPLTLPVAPVKDQLEFGTRSEATLSIAVLQATGLSNFSAIFYALLAQAFTARLSAAAFEHADAPRRSTGAPLQPFSPGFPRTPRWCLRPRVPGDRRSAVEEEASARTLTPVA
jgi:hypothetical protein